jgi:hypothetical protein
MLHTLSIDFDILVGGNSITNCNTRSKFSKILPVDMGQLDLGVGVEGDVEVLLGLGPLLVGGVSCLLETENSSKSKRVLTCKNIFSYTIITVMVLTIIVLDHLLANCIMTLETTGQYI